MTAQNRTPSPRIGGSFAPPIDDEKLSDYLELSKSAPPQIAEAIKRLVIMMREFRKTAPSREQPAPHPSGKGRITPLSESEQARMFEHIPWTGELDMYATLFEALPTGTRPGPVREVTDSKGRTFLKEVPIVIDDRARSLRNACFHLLWFARELDLDREPCTSDQL